MATSTSTPVALPANINAYNQQLNLSMQNYANLMAGYNQAQANVSSTLPGIYAGYDELQQGLHGVSDQAYKVGAQDIQAGATKTLGSIKSQAINSGLGNSTVQFALQNQAQSLANREFGRLSLGVAQQEIDRRSQIGLARLGAQQQGLGLQTGLAQSYMGNLSGYHFPAPGNLYGQASSSYSPDHGGGGYGSSRTGGGGSSPFSSWLSNSGIPMYGGQGPSTLGVAQAYGQPYYGGGATQGYNGYDYEANPGNSPFAGFAAEGPNSGSGEDY